MKKKNSIKKKSSTKNKILLIISLVQGVLFINNVRKKIVNRVVTNYIRAMRGLEYKKMRDCFADNSLGVSYDFERELSEEHYNDVYEFLSENLNELTFRVLKTKKVQKGVYTVSVEFGHINSQNIIKDIFVNVLSTDLDITDEDKEKLTNQLFLNEKARLLSEKVSTKVIFKIAKIKGRYKIVAVTKNLDDVYTSNYFKDKENEETKEEVKQEIKEEPKQEVKEEPKQEIEEEIKQEPKQEVKEEPKQEIEEEIKQEPKQEIEEEVKNENE